MASIVEKLWKQNLISPPKHMKRNIQYEVIMGSIAYGCNEDNSDMDIYGFSIPYKNIIFPHLTGHIQGFGTHPPKFEQYSEHHIKTENVEYDLSIYNIIKYFQLIMENNPNMIDSLFVPQRCILHCTNIGNHVREHRKSFLHKGCWPKFKGYSFSSLNKMKNKNIFKYFKFCEEHEIDIDLSIEEIENEIKRRKNKSINRK